jgi:hypothetical protein
VLIDQGGLHVDDFAAFGEAVDDEGVHAVNVRNSHVNEEVVSTRG